MIDRAGFEADDVIATLATEARDRGEEVVVVTGDRDTYQLVEDPLVKVLYNRRGVSDYVLYDEAGIRARTGVSPAQYPEYAALRGDPSDNLPGVPGVGEKTAARLITTHGGLDGVFSHLDELTPKLRQSLTDHEVRARQNAEVMVLLRDVPLGLGPLTWPGARSTPTGCGSCLTSWSSGPCTSDWSTPTPGPSRACPRPTNSAPWSGPSTK
jgi:DNA polymerase-1